MEIIGIAAVAKNLAIGKNGKLPWHYPADLRFFKRTTSGNAVLMGSATYKSIGKPLPGRLNIVLSRSFKSTDENVIVLNSPEQAVSLSKHLRGDLFIIGGGETYRAFSDKIDKWIVTQIPETVEDADAFMPENFLDGFQPKQSIDLEDDLHVKMYVRRA